MRKLIINAMNADGMTPRKEPNWSGHKNVIICAHATLLMRLFSKHTMRNVFNTCVDTVPSYRKTQPYDYEGDSRRGFVSNRAQKNYTCKVHLICPNLICIYNCDDAT